jgi:DNA-binding NarL/FixJ family response regulator
MTLVHPNGALRPSVDRPATSSSHPLPATGVDRREREVLRLMADGMSTREVAGEMNYSERTIKNVLQDLTARLHLRNRTHAVAYAVRHGWI